MTTKHPERERQASYDGWAQGALDQQEGVAPEPRGPHGLIGTYTNQGCRCDPCKKAMAEFIAARRAINYAKPKAADDPRHGTANFYNAHGCRCSRCREASTIAYKNRRLAAARANDNR